MFPWMMPNATMGGQMSLLSLMMGGGAQNPYAMFPPQQKNPFDRADQTPQGNQPDGGNAMAPGQQPPGGPDRNSMSGYDPNTVSPGWEAPTWMKVLGGGPQRNNQRGNPMAMGLLGLSMLQPRQPNVPRPYPWI